MEGSSDSAPPVANRRISILRNFDALYVEDDAVLRDDTADLLRGFFRDLVVAADGEEGLRVFDSRPIHLVIADLRMPKMNGLEMTAAIRQRDLHVPIFITSAYAKTDELLEAMRLNLADYLVKPLSWARLKEALGRSAERILAEGRLFTRFDADTTYCVTSDCLYRAGQAVHLTNREKALLDLLLKHRGQWLSKDRILAQVYGDDENASEAGLKNLILRLRQKIGADHIANMYGMGFMLRQAPHE
ncbi:MAG: response regulator transcription factor [Rhodoferax sp.]|uniref:response regulator transcription factor n=1 Tax=Rhodoferax sp. TaxID=50421 RepID=UPI002615E882|nr:response regulator transcription factor [Rhodoferax sp.]MDD5335175.1 response regulator transcription factor [Rhodoferax sp.]